jgi:hypothetical protein
MFCDAADSVCVLKVAGLLLFGRPQLPMSDAEDAGA